MTPSDDRGDEEGLAPVTPLFARSSGEAGSRARHPSAHRNSAHRNNAHRNDAYQTSAHESDDSARGEVDRPTDAEADGPDARLTLISAAFGFGEGLGAGSQDESLDGEIEPGTELETLVDDAADLASARDAAVRAMGRRDASRRELESTLRERGFGDEVVQRTMDDLEERGYHRDLDSAARIAERLQERKGLGRAAVGAELVKRRFSPAAITEVLAGIDAAGEADAAAELAEKRAHQLRGLDRETAQRRLAGFLQRRGFAGDIVRTAVASAIETVGFDRAVQAGPTAGGRGGAPARGLGRARRPGASGRPGVRFE